MNIYELTKQMALLQDLLEDNIEDEDFIEAFDALDGEVDDKVEELSKMVKNLESSVNGFSEEIKRLTDKKKVLENNITRTKKLMFNLLKISGKSKIAGKLFTVSIRKNGGKMPLLFLEGKEVPKEFLKAVYSEDKDKIRAALEAGEVLDFAYLGDRGESLSIK